MSSAVNGCIGISPQTPEQGDAVAIVQSSGVPLVLHRQGGHFGLIGTSYVSKSCKERLSLVGAGQQTPSFKQSQVIKCQFL
jgi:hypothetical protein